MNDLERFQAVCRGQSVDYVPLIGLRGRGLALAGPGVRLSRLLDTGMPPSCRAGIIRHSGSVCCVPGLSFGNSHASARDFWPSDPAEGVQFVKRLQDGYEIIDTIPAPH